MHSIRVFKVHTWVRVAGLILVLSGLGALVLLVHGSGNTGKQVRVTREGFFPPSITLRVGDQATFRVDDAITVHIQADVGNGTIVYPELDSDRELQKGDSWSFQPQRIGAWKYHDRLNPERKGIITVILEDFTDYGVWGGRSLAQGLGMVTRMVLLFTGRIQQVAEVLNAYTITEKSRWQMVYWMSALDVEPFIGSFAKSLHSVQPSNCHAVAHRLGYAAYEMVGEKVFTYRDVSFCHSGFYHGAIESWFRRGMPADVALEAERICRNYTSALDRFNCFHGFGHAFMTIADYDIYKAVAMCQKQQDAQSRRDCHSGVFMENTLVGLGLGSGHYTKWITEDITVPCRLLPQDEDIQVPCWADQFSRYLVQAGKDISSLMTYCATANTAYKKLCYDRVGMEIANSTNRDKTWIAAICQSVPEEYRNDCIQGALNNVLSYWGSSVSNRLFTLCENISGTDERRFCFSFAVLRLSELLGEDETNTLVCANSMDYIELRNLRKCP